MLGLLGPTMSGPIWKILGPVGIFRAGKFSFGRRSYQTYDYVFLCAWTSKMANIMDPILPIVSILGYWAIILGSFGAPGEESWRARDLFLLLVTSSDY